LLKVLEDLELFAPENNFDYIVGLDEVGRGCIAGPVTVAACLVSVKELPLVDVQGVRDSKKISPKKRNLIKELLEQNPYLEFELQNIEAPVIDEINILQATFLGMHKACDALLKRLAIEPDKVALLVDGHLLPPFCKSKNFAKVLALTKGDSRSFVIAAASIMAKESRDLLMKKHSQNFPQYMWQNNAGYPTAMHKQAVRESGLTKLHRRSFKST